MGQKVSFYLYIAAFVLVAAVTAYLIIDNSWYQSVNPFVLLCMYAGIGVVSFGMREEMLGVFDK
ncbi:hypothetical protein [Ectobacillus ponti]|uniref:Uncharacterized protein n=1 Tax=Ectobacillus ponti TaxID=2961894 RepID=A0AA41X5M2_9BACI|nr:hypothetical protein [Ectobacillus ponti]MCP8967084.1 hypothetical protein [Ectobacillus ponti]